MLQKFLIVCDCVRRPVCGLAGLQIPLSRMCPEHDVHIKKCIGVVVVVGAIVYIFSKPTTTLQYT